MSRNLFAQFKKLLPEDPLQVGTVVAVAGGVATIELPDGGLTTARGVASLGQSVFFRGGVIEGPAPSLPVELIEV